MATFTFPSIFSRKARLAARNLKAHANALDVLVQPMCFIELRRALTGAEDGFAHALRLREVYIREIERMTNELAEVDAMLGKTRAYQLPKPTEVIAPPTQSNLVARTAAAAANIPRGARNEPLSYHVSRTNPPSPAASPTQQAAKAG